MVVHLVAKLIVCGDARTRMVAGDPESDAPASERINFLNLFDIGTGPPGFFSPRLRVTPWSRSRVVTAHISDIFRQRRTMEWTRSVIAQGVPVIPVGLYLLPTVQNWVFRNLGGDFHARGLITRRLSNSNPARPYICRFSIFRRFTWPSTTPLLHLLLIASCIAVASASIPAATR